MLGPFSNRAVRHLVEEKPEEPFVGGQHVDIGGDHRPLQTRVGKDLPDVAEVGVEAEDGFGTRVVDQISDLVRGVDGRDGHGNGPHLLRAEVPDQELGAVGEVEHDLVAAPYPQVVKGRGKDVDQSPGLPVGELLPEIDEGRLVGVLFTRPVKTGNDELSCTDHPDAP